MATQQTGTVYITNNTGGNANIYLFHENSTNGTQAGAWYDVPSGQSAGPLTVYYKTGFPDWGVLDYWSVLIHVTSGPNAGFYVSGENFIPFWTDYWKECQLESGDVGNTINLSVDTSTFNVSLPTNGCTGPMMQLTPATPITHVFVVMLENHSFDNVFAMSGIPGITAATTSNSNSIATGQGTETYNVQSSAQVPMPTDPGHEFLDVVEQLCGQSGENAPYGQNAPWPPPTGQSYPSINNSGFAANYSTSTSEDPPPSPPAPPPSQDIGEIMDCFATQTQLPNIYGLAQLGAICDHWYSSLPGPTWPNRFFLHGASSSGMDDSPTQDQMKKWELPGDGFEYPNGSIYQKLDGANIPYRFYNDTYPPIVGPSIFSDDPQNGSIVGGVAQVSALQGVTMADIHSLKDLQGDLQGPYPYPYTFIEPNYGDVTGGTYAGGSSQHPMDDSAGGENLLSYVYGAIRNSPYWNTSLLIVLYDEHGGFYDSVSPPTGVTAPGDNPQYGYNTHGFDFTTLGVRVPAVLVSPLITAGTVDSTPYDHSSVLALLEKLWNLTPLTNRDATANSPYDLLSQATSQDMPAVLPRRLPPRQFTSPTLTKSGRALILSQPLPQSGNLVGALAILHKTDLELSDGTPEDLAATRTRYATVRTRADAETYAAHVMEKARTVQMQRKLAQRKKS